MTQKILSWGFYILFFVTPLFFLPLNNELFEYNKMMLVYVLTSIITVIWLIKMVNLQSFIFNRTPLDIPIILFLLSQILSTVLSIDQHTSIFGYYSRSNGGLLSIISYILLYYALISNFTKEQVLKFLKVAVLGGVAVSLYAIPEHFGLSPSCVILTQTLTADCWVQDVQARVFATLGQPNWLAAYLGMLIFPSLYFVLTEKKNKSIIVYSIFSILIYMAFTFTYSRGGMVGFLVGLLVFVVLHYGRTIKQSFSPSKIISFFSSTGAIRLSRRVKWRSTLIYNPFLLLTFSFLLINLLFGSSLTGNFKLIREYAPPRPALSSGTQLEQGGTESGQIRLIVWKGALDIFKHYPILGSGVETFAYSYYNFRPVEHNNTSEWDFLYNKAHNEFLNYLATTGVLGFGAYMLLIGGFIFWSIKYYVLCIKQKKHTTHYLLLTTSLLASYVSYLIQNVFGFSVVIIALLFYVFPAVSFVVAEDVRELRLPKNIGQLFLSLFKFKVVRITSSILLSLVLVFFLGSILRLWMADYFYKNGTDALDDDKLREAFVNLSQATELNKSEPLYRSELGFATASVATAIASDDATSSAELSDEAVRQTEDALKISPKNVSLWRTAVRTYYQLSAIDPKYVEKSSQAIDETIKLAPTDPKLYYNKGLVLSQTGNIEEGAKFLDKATQLKPDYKEAHFTLSLLYEQLAAKDKAKTKEFIDKAIFEMEQVLKYDPSNEDAKRKIEELKK